MTEHSELEKILKTRNPKTPTPRRKMLTCSEADHEKLANIAHELGAPISKTIGALIAYYLEEDFEKTA